MEPTVFLFDMDGVLVQPGGYRASVRATVNYFANRLGLGDIAPDDATIAIFEAQGITCEWDMIPILLALILEAAMERTRLPDSLPSFRAACEWFQRYPVPGLVIDYPALLRRLGSFVRVGEAPAESILAAAQSGQANDIFPRLSGQAVLAELLSHSRHLTRSLTTAIFETFALGDTVYTHATGLTAPVRSESLLHQNDWPLLTPETRDRLCALQQQNGLRMAAYTARPSLPDGEQDVPLAVFAPEAELALERLGWQDLMLVGSGQMGEAAWHLGESEDRLTKPAPYHAVAAVASAWTGNRPAALSFTEQVFCYFEPGQACQPVSRPVLVNGSFALPPRLHLHIFEDSPSGMRGGMQSVELLAELGMAVRLSLWGVTDHPEKMAALQALGAQVFPDVNQAVEAALRLG